MKFPSGGSTFPDPSEVAADAPMQIDGTGMPFLGTLLMSAGLCVMSFLPHGHLRVRTSFRGCTAQISLPRSLRKALVSKTKPLRSTSRGPRVLR